MSAARTVIKRDHTGSERLRWQGLGIASGDDWQCIAARFALPARDLGYVALATGDLFTEWFYSARYYNIFRVQSADASQLKGWYCNFTRPAIFSDALILHDDLALDLWVAPDYTTRLLDEDEYAGLPLSAAERAAVAAAHDELCGLISARSGAFVAP